jgi:cell shape-determining protein MreC
VSLAFTAKLAEMLVMLKKQAEELEELRADLARLRQMLDAAKEPRNVRR